MAGTLSDFTATKPDGSAYALSELAGKVVLVVNTASKCGFTPQYEGLQELYRTYRDRGFEIVAFPCNQFGRQEPGSADEIAEFCSVNYGVEFPVMARIDVNGSDAPPLYDWLKSEARGLFGTQAIKWNFTKFLLDREGKVVRRYAPTDKPQGLEKDIEALL
ncbi:glutathione peroxidase [Novosphingobium marinum]|uniref:Glutathione peroxidase n=1 Tax=Novosphingobium marinum TaxID=1514948 RepID=A0A7Y9XSX8_9SPHN|nr:glutathione peroxidase [Novosphingobium marinum]NYH93939.1 glutathione peroxidase [Novosphingobium marinum]GGC18424.1 glutathione peroxidase [Novosphingobium marinum]